MSRKDRTYFLNEQKILSILKYPKIDIPISILQVLTSPKYVLFASNNGHTSSQSPT
ncbi:Uncharacterised protein [Sphingobacterium daejeonense]|nr:Uncharacterised protein [Sphingobacterium daejeonense]